VGLSADGTTAFVTAPVLGAIYVFHVSAEDAWASSSTPTATLTGATGVFSAVALSADGSTLVAGAPFYNGEDGGAHVFHASSESAWVSTSTPAATLTNAAQASSDRGAGFAVAMSADGTTVLVADEGNAPSGGAYVYHVSAADSWATTATPTATLTDED